MSEFIRDDYIADRVLFAADEIKRLRAENARLREHFVKQNKQDVETNKKLRTTLELIADAPNGYAQQYARAALEETK